MLSIQRQYALSYAMAKTLNMAEYGNHWMGLVSQVSSKIILLPSIQYIDGETLMNALNVECINTPKKCEASRITL